MIKIITSIVIILFGITTALAQIESEEIVIKNGEIELPGTLTFTKEKSPLIIWVHGSGNVDRNGNQAGTPVKANYIKEFRDSVNKKNIAFFSYDKRTANKKNYPYLKDTKIRDFVIDVETVISHFKKEKQFSEIILAGHSQGSLIAMLASKNIDKYISIAGSGETIDKIMTQQIKKNNPMLGVIVKKQFDTLRIKGKIEKINPFLVTLFSKRNQPFLYSWLQIDPLEEIKKLTIPTLIIQGEKDTQVTIEDATKLKKANTNAKLVFIKNMNHVLKTIEKEEDNLKSYYSSDFPLSKELIETVVQFVNN
ncbi:serine aminopeptidase domain-containing protein [Polaribacter sp. OB-PA-B3]